VVDWLSSPGRILEISKWPLASQLACRMKSLRPRRESSCGTRTTRGTAVFHRSSDATAIGFVENCDGRRGRGQFHGFARHFALRHTKGSEVVGVHRSPITR